MIRTRKVKLPEDDLILLSNFTLAIAQARYPTENLKGIECIAGLLDTTKGWLYKLMGKNLAKMERLLASLPPLEYPIEPAMEENFLRAYRNHSGKLDTRDPRFITTQEVEVQRLSQIKAEKEHSQTIREMNEQGKIRLVNGNHVPVQTLSYDTYIVRENALEYLEKCGLDVEESLPLSRDNVCKTSEKEDIFSAGKSWKTNDTNKQNVSAKRGRPAFGEMKYAKIALEIAKATREKYPDSSVSGISKELMKYLKSTFSSPYYDRTICNYLRANGIPPGKKFSKKPAFELVIGTENS